MKRWICLFLIELVMFISCSPQSKDNEAMLFSWYTEQINLSIGNDIQHVIIVPNESCNGCRSIVSKYSFAKKNNEIIIVSNKIAPQFKDCPVKIDSMAICDKLNWEYANIIEVFINHGVCDSVKDYDAEETVKRFHA